MLPALFCNRSGFEHRVQHPEVVEKIFPKVLKISWIFRISGHCILKNATLSTGCYSIMGQNMGHTFLRENAKIISELLTPKTQEKVLKSFDFRTFLVAEAGLEPTTVGTR